ncbi:hypothetical protein SteCoe_202 [Stentor coeruleus]|uniref:Uncharacterized protein n=1 Tax=Stentor coeruleus TaxID=5963 RepID=A0A1R2D4P8_9CILI|nr:hypothetical protein SteCoe_202 [Stentor coeruleus]
MDLYMDFSGSTDFDMTFEDQVIVPRVFKPVARTPRFKNTMNMYSASPTNESNDDYDKVPEESFGPYAFYVKSEMKKVQKNRQVYVKRTCENGLKDDSIPDIRNKYMKNNSFQECRNGYFKAIVDFEEFHNVRNCEVRRLKLGKYHNRCQTSLIGDGGNECLLIKRVKNNIKFMKKELIPQTKANNNLKYQSPSTVLKIKGIIKNFTIRRQVKT